MLVAFCQTATLSTREIQEKNVKFEPTFSFQNRNEKMGRLANWLVLPAVFASWEFNFGNFGPGEEILVFSDALQKDPTLQIALWDVSDAPSEANLVSLSCRRVQQSTFENSNEPLLGIEILD